MKLSSTRLTKSNLKAISGILKATGHPTRINIIEMLLEKKLSVSEIQKGLKVSQPIASQHLLLLQRKGVLNSEKVGRNRFFFIKNEHIVNMLKSAIAAIEK